MGKWAWPPPLFKNVKLIIAPISTSGKLQNFQKCGYLKRIYKLLLTKIAVVFLFLGMLRRNVPLKGILPSEGSVAMGASERFRSLVENLEVPL